MRPNIFKCIITLPYFLNVLRKSKSWYKKMIKDPRLVSEQSRYFWVKKIGKYILWLHNVKLHTLGMENWLDGPVFIAANHQSYMDGAVIFALNNFKKTAPCAFLGKQELKKEKKLFRFLSLIDVLFIDRTNLRQQAKVFNEANELIKVPRSMVVFPEGTRNANNNSLIEFKDGAFKLAQKAYVPIVPVTIYNSHNAFTDSRYKRKHIHIIFHKPIMPNNFMHMNTAALSLKVKKIIQSGLDNIKDHKLKIKEEIKNNKRTKKIKKSKNNKYLSFKNMFKK